MNPAPNEGFRVPNKGFWVCVVGRPTLPADAKAKNSASGVSCLFYVDGNRIANYVRFLSSYL